MGMDGSRNVHFANNHPQHPFPTNPAVSHPMANPASGGGYSEPVNKKKKPNTEQKTDPEESVGRWGRAPTFYEPGDFTVPWWDIGADGLGTCCYGTFCPMCLIG